MMAMRGCRILGLGVAGLALSGCVAAVPVAPTYTVIPGQGKTEGQFAGRRCELPGSGSAGLDGRGP